MHATGLTVTSAALPTASVSVAAEQSNLAARSHGTYEPIVLLGVAFDNLTLRETVDHIDKMIVSRHPHQVVTANGDFLVQARSDLELQRILLNAYLANVLIDTPTTSDRYGNIFRPDHRKR